MVKKKSLLGDNEEKRKLTPKTPPRSSSFKMDWISYAPSEYFWSGLKESWRSNQVKKKILTWAEDTKLEALRSKVGQIIRTG